MAERPRLPLDQHLFAPMETALGLMRSGVPIRKDVKPYVRRLMEEIQAEMSESGEDEDPGRYIYIYRKAKC